MAVNEEVAIPCVLILADARFNDRGLSERWDMFRDKRAQPQNGSLRDNPMIEIRIQSFSVKIKPKLEAAAFNVRQRIRNIWMLVIKPDRHARRFKAVAARRRAKKKDFLPRRKDAAGKQLRKNFGQPGSAGKDEGSGGNPVTFNRLQLA